MTPSYAPEASNRQALRSVVACMDEQECGCEDNEQSFHSFVIDLVFGICGFVIIGMKTGCEIEDGDVFFCKRFEI